MSARSRDLISATLITAGIPCAAEIYMAAGPSTAAFGSYWKDWFDNEKWDDSTRGIQASYDKMSSGRNDVLLVAPGTHEVSTALAISKDYTHIIGCGPRSGAHGDSVVVRIHGAITPMFQVSATGCLFANFTVNHSNSTASTAAFTVVQVTSGSAGLVMRDMYIRTPNDASLAASTGWSPIVIEGGINYFENCLFGGRAYARTGGGEVAMFSLAKGNNSLRMKDCVTTMRSTGLNTRFFHVTYSPWGGSFIVAENCHFLNASTVAWYVAIASTDGACPHWTEEVMVYFDTNCCFAGVTDICAAANESVTWFGRGALIDATGNASNAFTGLASHPDHST